MTSELSFTETFKKEFGYLREDYKIFYKRNIKTDNFLSLILNLLMCHGLHIMCIFRFGKVVYSIKIPVISHIGKILFQFLRYFFFTFYGIWLGPLSEFGPGFYIGHYGGIVVRGKFGKNCSISQGVTIGSKGAGKTAGWPVFGDNVYIAAGAKIIGDVKIGSNVVIGANAVVLTDIPDNSMAVGIPAKIKPMPQKTE
ncbi:MAG: serine O-acetyltransferase [Cellvibrionaceae bacterium]